MEFFTAILGAAVIWLVCWIAFTVSEAVGWLRPQTMTEPISDGASAETEERAKAEESADAEEVGETEDSEENEELLPEADQSAPAAAVFWYRSPLILLTILISCAVWIVHTLFSENSANYPQMIADALLISFMTLLTWIDLRSRIVPNRLLSVMTILWIAVTAIHVILSPETGIEQFLRGLSGSLMGGIPFLLCYLITRRQLGGGDVKLSFIMGLYLTGQRIMGAVFYGVMLSSVWCLILLCAKKIRMKDGIPLVPFLYIGTAIVLAIT